MSMCWTDPIPSCLSGPQFVQSPVRFGSPKIMDISVFCWVQALNKAVSKKRPRFTWKRKSLICNIFYAHVHVVTLAMDSTDGKGAFSWRTLYIPALSLALFGDAPRAFPLKQSELAGGAPVVATCVSIGMNHTVAGHQHGHRIGSAGGPDGTGRPRTAHDGGNLAVAAHRSRRNILERPPDCHLKIRALEEYTRPPGRTTRTLRKNIPRQTPGSGIVPHKIRERPVVVQFRENLRRLPGVVECQMTNPARTPAKTANPNWTRGKPPADASVTPPEFAPGRRGLRFGGEGGFHGAQDKAWLSTGQPRCPRPAV